MYPNGGTARGGAKGSLAQSNYMTQQTDNSFQMSPEERR